MDQYGTAASWHLKEGTATTVKLEAPYASSLWTLNVAEDARLFTVEESVSGRRYEFTLTTDGAGSLRKS